MFRLRVKASGLGRERSEVKDDACSAQELATAARTWPAMSSTPPLATLSQLDCRLVTMNEFCFRLSISTLMRVTTSTSPLGLPICRRQ